MLDSTNTVSVNIKYTIAPNLEVFDCEGKKVGTVIENHRVPGYFIVQVRPLLEKGDNPFLEKDLYVPFRLIANIDPREIFLSVTSDEARRDYADPPPRTTRVEEEFDTAVAVTTEPSGYDGTPIIVRRVRFNDLRGAIIAGDRVYSSDPAELGHIEQYDPDSGWMQIKRSGLSNEPPLRLPIALVDSVMRDKHEVHLVLSRADLRRAGHLVADVGESTGREIHKSM